MSRISYLDNWNPDPGNIDPNFQPYKLIPLLNRPFAATSLDFTAQHIMPAEDYVPATSGTLKLKGVQNSKISKKKKRPKHTQHSSSNQDPAAAQPIAGELSVDKLEPDADLGLVRQEKTSDRGDTESEETPLHGSRKTEAELRHDERRRKRVWFLVFGTFLCAS